MNETILELIKETKGLTLTRCFGMDKVLCLPDGVEGTALIHLGDHCFALEPSFLLKDRPKCYALDTGEGFVWISHQEAARRVAGMEAIAGDLLEEITLPAFLSAIGDYAFYGCRSLQAITFPASLQQLGRGVFVAANQIKTLLFQGAPGQLCPPVLRDVLGEISYETEVVLLQDGQVALRLWFPEYYEDSVENTPARIIWVKFEGTGYKYRQCFSGDQIDWKHYDDLRYEASVQELPMTVVRLCLDRLAYPVGLEDLPRSFYLECLRERPEALRIYLQEAPRMKLLKLLAAEGFFTPPLLEQFLETALQEQDGEMVSFLLDYRRQHCSGRPKGKHKYEL